MRAQCVLVATTLLHSGAKFYSFLYAGSKTVHVYMESCYVKADPKKCTLIQALRLCTGHMVHKESRGISLLFHDHSTRRG
jgi:hypothetical protein